VDSFECITTSFRRTKFQHKRTQNDVADMNYLERSSQMRWGRWGKTKGKRQQQGAGKNGGTKLEVEKALVSLSPSPSPSFLVAMRIRV